MQSRRICFILLFLMIVTTVVAKPNWVERQIDSEYFVYFVGTGTDSIKFDAKEKAMSNAMQKLSQFHLLQVQSITDYTETSKLINDVSYEYDETSQVITLVGDGVDIRGVRIVDEYTEKVKGKYHSSVLIRLPKSLEFATMPLYKNQSLSPIIKSALLPGWGQIAKNQHKKGHWIMATEGISALSALTFILVGNYYQDRSRDISLSYKEQERCRENANVSYLYGNISLALATLIYTYNIVDVVSSKNNYMFTKFQEIPIQITTTSNQASIALQIKF